MPQATNPEVNRRAIC